VSFHSQFQQPSQPDLQPGTAPTSKQQGFSKTVAFILVMLAFVLIVGGILFAFVGVIKPHQQHVQATATAQTQASQATETARMHANATAAVQASASAYAMATVTTLQDTYIQATSGNPTLNDALSSQNGNYWDEVSNRGEGSCSFKDNAYHAIAQQPDYLYACFATSPNFSNFAYQVQMTILQGDYGGIIFRANGASSKYYYFRVGKDGAYDLSVSHGTTSTHDQILKSGIAPSMITIGLNQPNLVEVLANGSNLYLYVNQKFLAQVHDNTYKSGQIGVFGGDFESKSANVAFTSAKVWKI
jgi:Tfp pilus assembly protein PilV